MKPGVGWIHQWQNQRTRGNLCDKVNSASIQNSEQFAHSKAILIMQQLGRICN